MSKYTCYNLSDLFSKLVSVGSSHTYLKEIRLTISMKVMLCYLC